MRPHRPRRSSPAPLAANLGSLARATLVALAPLLAMACAEPREDRPATEAAPAQRPPALTADEPRFTADDHAALVAIYNQSGCDAPADGQSCTPRGACCDTHDDCIDQACPAPYGDVRNCTAEAVASGACPQACLACHQAVITCFGNCTQRPAWPWLPPPPPLPPECQPAACCGPPNTCNQEQACYDRTVDPPELITDPCECEARGIPLTESPRRPEDHCCAATGWGCCAGFGQAPGDGNGGCCAPLWEENGVCTFRCMGQPPIALRGVVAATAAAALCAIEATPTELTELSDVP